MKHFILAPALVCFLVSAVLTGCGGSGSGSNSGNTTPPVTAPTVTSINPTTVTAGSAPLTLTINGTGFLSTTTVQVGGVADATTFVSGTQVTATVAAPQLQNTGPLSVVAFNGAASSASGAPINLLVIPSSPPTLTSISPNLGPINTAASLTLTGTGFTLDSTVALDGINIPSTYVSSTSLTVSIAGSSLILPGNLNLTVATPESGGKATAPLPYTAYIPISNNSMVYNPVNGLLYVSVPDSAGAPYGDSVVSVDPETGTLGTPIPVGSDPNQLAISSDGTILWVALDDDSAVRQVNLTTGTAGLQFPLAAVGAPYSAGQHVNALAALPGSPNSVVVAWSGYVAIFDSGVLRGTQWTNPSNAAYALLADGSKSEIYTAGSSYRNTGYITFSYNASGLSFLATAPAVYTFANYPGGEIQITGGTLYTDYGQAFNAETGAFLGSFNATGTTVASGPIFADTTLGLAFILDNSQGYAYGVNNANYNQVQVFNLSNYTPTGSVIPVNLPPVGQLYYSFFYPMHLTRWGSNGLAFQTQTGVFSLRSNLVKNLSAVSADLSVQLSANGGTATGTNTTFAATVSNAGPSAATNVALTAMPPSAGVLLSATPSSGTCSIGAVIACNLGNIASGASSTVQFVVLEDTPGSTTFATQASGSETDPNPANNNATATATVTGATYNLVPTITAISPAAINSGSNDTVITLTGTGFSTSSTILLGSSPLSTTYTSNAILRAVVPAAQLTTLGWTPITVSNPTPGGGVSTPFPLSIFTTLDLGAKEIVYDPYSRNIMATVNSTNSPNSLVAINPDTATLGTPVPIGSAPTSMALTSDGQILYVILSGSESVARFNMLNQLAEYSYVPTGSNFGNSAQLRGVAAQPGSENTVALDLGEQIGLGIFDFNPTAKTAAIRGQNTGPATGSCITFQDPSNLLAFDVDTSGQKLNHYNVTSAGFTYYDYSQFTQSSLNGFGCFKVNGGLAFADVGGVANPTTIPATQLGYVPIGAAIGAGPGAYGNVINTVAPDTSLNTAFYFVITQPLNAYNRLTPDGIQAVNLNTFMPSNTLFMNLEPIEVGPYQGVDLIRWGQDGLAALTNTGHVYLLRGPFVVPQELQQNTAATLASSSATTITHGAGNTLLTLTGSNFIPGVAVTWNGSYRTTTIVDATHVTVAIPASDLAAAGSASLVATNPGASASNALTVTIN